METTKTARQAKNYMAFISYSHADNREEGRKWADWLHHAIETYEIPEDLIGKENSIGEKIPQQIYPVFQDEKELSASSSLSDSLKSALQKTENLILLCSPKSARSIYVQDEVRYFKQIGKSKSIIALILSGEPQDEKHQTEIQCFPEVLKYAVDENGKVQKDKPEEPIAADVRTEDAAEGFTSAEGYRRMLHQQGIHKNQIQHKVNAYKDKLELARLKIISGILKVPLGELTKRDKEYELKKMKARNKRIKQIAVAISVLAIAAIISGFIALRQRNIAQDTLARSLYQTGVNSIANQDVLNGAAYIAAATRMGNKNASIYSQSMLSAQKQEVKIPNKQSASGVRYSKSGRWLSYITDNGIAAGQLQVWDAIALQPLKILASHTMQSYFSPQFSNDETKIYAIDKNNILEWDFEKNITSYLTNFDSTQKVLNFQLSDDNNIVHINFTNKTSAFYNIPEKRLLNQPQPLLDEKFSVSDNVLFSDNAAYAVLTSPKSSVIKLFSFSNGNIEKAETIRLDSNSYETRFNTGGTLLAVYNYRQLNIIPLNAAHVPQKINISSSINDVFFNPDSKTVVVSSTLNYEVYDIKTAAYIKSYPQTSTRNLFLPNRYVSPDLSQLLKTANDEVYVQNIANSPFLQSQFFLDTNFRRVVPSPDNESVFIFKKGEKSIEKWNAQSGEKVKDVFQTPDVIANFNIAKNAKIFYTVSTAKPVSKQVAIRFWNDKGDAIGKTVNIREQGPILLLTKDGKQFAARLDDNTLGIFSVKTGKPEKKYTSKKGIKNYLISPDFKYLLVLAPDKSWQLADINANKELINIPPGAETLIDGSFSPDGEYVTVRTTAGVVTFFTIPDGKEYLKINTQIGSQLNSFTGKQEPVLGVMRYNKAGTVLALSDDEYNIRLWNVKEKTPFGQVIKSTPKIIFFDFYNNDKNIYAVQGRAGENNILIYDAADGYVVSQPFGYGTFSAADVFENGNSILTISPMPNSFMFNFWEVPGKMSVSNDQLATDVENVFGEKYNLATGAITGTKKVANKSNSWYFQDPYTRKATPGAEFTIIDNINKHIPIKNETDLNYLAVSQMQHPLSRAAVADYFAKDPYTGFIAQRLIEVTKSQLYKVKDTGLKTAVEKQLKSAEDQLKK